MTTTTRRLSGGPLKNALFLSILTAIFVAGGCSNDDDEPVFPPEPDDKKNQQVATRRLVVHTVGGKIAVTEVYIWRPALENWELINPSPLLIRGLGANTKVSVISTTSTGGNQQAVRFPTMALFTGGVAGRGTFASDTAYLYDHRTEEWTFLTMSQPRVQHTSTTLLDNRVLIVGGWDGDLNVRPHVALASTEIFNAADKTFSPAAPLLTGRSNHTAALLRDGRVLVCGGSDMTGFALASTEIYDPASNSFTPGPPMSAARGGEAIALDDGRVLVLGGIETRTVEFFDPAAGAFTSIGPTNAFHGYGLTATKLKDGQVLVVGGTDPNAEFYPTDVVERFDPATNTFTTVGTLSPGRYLHAAVLLDDGRVLISGGQTANGGFLKACVLFDPASNSFTPTGDLPNVNSEFVGAYLERPE